jgi:hypothetical protein
MIFIEAWQVVTTVMHDEQWVARRGLEASRLVNSDAIVTRLRSAVLTLLQPPGATLGWKVAQSGTA